MGTLTKIALENQLRVIQAQVGMVHTQLRTIDLLMKHQEEVTLQHAQERLRVVILDIRQLRNQLQQKPPTQPLGLRSARKTVKGWGGTLRSKNDPKGGRKVGKRGGKG